jgi:signal transduction histidine kinase
MIETAETGAEPEQGEGVESGEEPRQSGIAAPIDAAPDAVGSADAPSTKAPASAESAVEPNLLSEAIALCVHDLRNPLSAIYSDALFLHSSAPLDAEGREVLSEIVIACDSIGHIIENVSLLGGSLRPEDAPVLRTFELAPLMREVVEGMGRTARGYRVNLSLNINCNGITVHSHTELLSRALANLVRNALENAPEGSQVRVDAAIGATHAEVHVRDDVESVPDGRGDVFSLDSQVHAKRRHERYGRGLGLYCARLSAQAAGADVAFVPGPPNRLTLTVPLAGR